MNKFNKRKLGIFQSIEQKQQQNYWKALLLSQKFTPTETTIKFVKRQLL